jgi:hypothetical protein
MYLLLVNMYFVRLNAQIGHAQVDLYKATTLIVSSFSGFEEPPKALAEFSPAVGASQKQAPGGVVEAR